MTVKLNPEAVLAEVLAVRKIGFVWKGKELVEELVAPKAFIRPGSSRTVVVSAEAGDGYADYYNEFGNGAPHIDKSLLDFAEARGLYWEWEDPGSIALYL